MIKMLQRGRLKALSVARHRDKIADMQLLTFLVCAWKIYLPESGNLVAVCGEPEYTTAVTYTPSGMVFVQCFN
jgi:hypothetical protein